MYMQLPVQPASIQTLTECRNVVSGMASGISEVKKFMPIIFGSKNVAELVNTISSGRNAILLVKVLPKNCCVLCIITET